MDDPENLEAYYASQELLSVWGDQDCDDEEMWEEYRDIQEKRRLDFANQEFE